VFKRVLDINFERGYTNLKILSTIRYQLKKPSFNKNLEHFIFELGGGAVLLLWANTFSPFDMNRQKWILASEI
jgi:5'-3' exonuclease